MFSVGVGYCILSSLILEVRWFKWSSPYRIASLGCWPQTLLGWMDLVRFTGSRNIHGLVHFLNLWWHYIIRIKWPKRPEPLKPPTRWLADFFSHNCFRKTGKEPLTSFLFPNKSWEELYAIYPLAVWKLLHHQVGFFSIKSIFTNLLTYS